MYHCSFLSLYNHYKDHHFELLKELIFINEKMGNYKENLDIFRDGHQKGYFFLIHPSLPRYKAYLDFDEFQKISDTDLYLRDSANSVAESQVLIVEPDNFKRSRIYPLIFIYHGGGSNAEKASGKWTSEELDKKYIRVFLQSSRHSDYSTFGWRNSDSIAVKLLEEAYIKVKSTYKIDSSDLVVAGISAGATSALYSGFSSSVPVTGVIAICTGIPELLQGQEYLKNAGVEVVLVAGENDHYRPRQERLVDSLSKYNIQYNYSILPGMGHEYPSDFNLFLNKIL